MTPESFVKSVKEAVVDENVGLYEELLKTTDRGAVRDEYWRSLLALYDRLGPDDRAVLIAVMKQVAFDSVSNVFGILDGSSSSSVGRETIRVLDDRGNMVNGDLQELLMSAYNEP